MDLVDYCGRRIRFTDERIKHLEDNHPEMVLQIEKIKETLINPDLIIESRSDRNVELFYKYFRKTPVNVKFLCVVVKINNADNFVITAYFTDGIKKGKILWEKK